MGSGKKGGRVAVVVGAVVLVALAVVTPLTIRALSSKPVVMGLADGAVVSADGVRDLAVTVPEGTDPHEVRLLLDGRPVAATVDGDRVLLTDEVAEGEHTLTARVPDSVPLLPDEDMSRTFTVDRTPPALSVSAEVVTDLRKPVEVTGSAEGAAELTVDGKAVPLGPDGAFAVTLPTAATAKVAARDTAGNAVEQDFTVPTRHPGMRAVHMSAAGWASKALREPVLRLIEDGRIDTVQLDIKDESGEVGYDSRVPLAREIGATKGYYDAKAVVDELHGMGVRVVGRLVAFRDPILGRASWESGKADRVIQNAGGGAWSSGYGQFSFTNFAHPAVIAYNIDLAEEAARLGFDDILYDYIRRPEGALGRMKLPGLKGTPEQAIVDFVAKSRAAVRPHGAFVGVSVFGIAATRPGPVAQDIPAIAKHADYIAPMVYPSHWGPGEYGVADPVNQPYEITGRSVGDFVKKVKGSNSVVIPWLQAFSLGSTYGPAEIRAQIEASKSVGAPSFLLWDPACRYDPAALAPKP
ncbi:putative glycoside hydrolase [Actinokineospora sp. 24-640]